MTLENRNNALPRSGYITETRVAAAATLVRHVAQSNRNAVVPTRRNPFRVVTTRRRNPGLKQPWALGRNRFAVVPLGAISMHLKAPLTTDN